MQEDDRPKILVSAKTFFFCVTKNSVQTRRTGIEVELLDIQNAVIFNCIHSRFSFAQQCRQSEHLSIAHSLMRRANFFAIGESFFAIHSHLFQQADDYYCTR